MFPSIVEVAKLAQQHPDYVARKARYCDLGTMYDGENISGFLRRRPSELTEVYGIRQQMLSYTNLLSNVVGWYRSAMFNAAPQITKKDAKQPATPDGKPKLATDAQEFCDAFEADCDGAGGSFVNFWADALECLLLYQAGYVMIDLPLPDSEAPPMNRAQQEQGGLLNPFLMLYEPSQVINWAADARGNLEWAVIYVRVQDQEFLGPQKLMDYWHYFNRTECVLYEREVPSDEGEKVPDKAMASLAPGYPRRHAMSDMGEVPLRRVEVPKGLWLGNRIYRPLMNHLNLDNSLDFGLFQSNLAQLCIENGDAGEYRSTAAPDGRIVSSEVGFHLIPHGGKMYYLEPSGNSFTISQDRINSLEERIYKACYLQDQARTNASTPTAQSGISKEQDKTPSRDAMSGLGDVLRDAMQAVYQDVLEVRGLVDVVVDIRAFDFSDKATAQDLDQLDKGGSVTVNSETFEREIQKRKARLQLPDGNAGLLTTIDKEIDRNPTPSQIEAQRVKDEQAAMAAQFSASMQAAGAAQ